MFARLVKHLPPSPKLSPRRSAISHRRLALEPLESRTLLTAAPTITSLSVSTATANFNQPVTFLAQVVTNPPTGSTPTGSVDFIDTTTGDDLGAVSLSGGLASLTLSTLAAGTHTVRAHYLGNVDFAASYSPSSIGGTSIITTVAGTGAVDFSGDGGPATSATLNGPVNIASDAAGNVFIIDYYNHRVRRVDHATGTITTVAGNGLAGYNGDGQAATAAELNQPVGIAIDAEGNIFIGDTGNHRVRRIDHLTHTIATVAGTGTRGYSGDGGLATSAQLAAPEGIAVDELGNLFIAEYGNHLVRKVNLTSGIITTVAGVGTSGYSGDQGSARAAQLSNPAAVAINAAGELFIADWGNSCIRKVTVAGQITTVAGTGNAGYNGDGSNGPDVQLNFPKSIALNNAGNLFIADSGNNALRELDLATGAVTTIAGQPTDATGQFSGDFGYAADAQLNAPQGVGFDVAGNLFVADCNNNRIRRLLGGAASVRILIGTSTLSFDAPPQGFYGGTVNLTATLSLGGIGLSNQPIVFTLGGANLGTVTTNSQGTATLRETSLSGFSPGNYVHYVTASFLGTASLAGVASVADLTVNRAPLTVTAQDAAKIFGAPDPVFAASYVGFVADEDPGNLGGTLAFATDEPTSGNAPVGAYRITPSGLTSNNYAIRFVSGTLTVSPLTLSVTANNAIKLYGTPDPVFTATYAGFLPGEGVGNLGGTLSFTTNEPSSGSAPVGDYQITPAGLTSNNYTIQFVSGTLSVTSRDLTITANDARKIYGSADPTFDVSYAGFLPAEGPADLGGTLAFTTNEPTDKPAPVGDYQIRPSGLTSANYTLHFAAGTLHVTPLTLTVTANDASKPYGNADPPFSVTYAGFLSGEGPSNLGGNLSFTTDQPSGSSAPVGSYHIRPAGLTAANYALEFVDGLLAVTPLALIITAQNANKSYGSADPAFSVSYAGFLPGESASNLQGTLVFTTNEPIQGYAPVGDYQILPSGLTSANYTLSFMPGPLTVTPIALAVTAVNARKTYGSADPPFAVSYAGFAAGEDAAQLSGTLAFATNEPPSGLAPIGDYLVTPSGLTSGNYLLSFYSGVLTVERRGLTVTANDTRRLYGARNPLFAVSYFGFAPGEGPGNLGGALTFTTTEPHGPVPVGSYQIIPAGLTAANYALSFNPGLLTVTPAAQTAGLFDPQSSWFHLRNTNSTGPDDELFGYGQPGGGWNAMVGDWNGDGVTGVALYDPYTSYFMLTNAFTTGFAEAVFGYGVPRGGWIPLVGDWDGDGRAGVGLYDPTTANFYLTNTLSTGVAEYAFGFGAPNSGWIPLVGDWNGDGTSGVGLYDPHTSYFYLINSLKTAAADRTFGYGVPNAGWIPFVGDWNGDGATGVGLYDPKNSKFYLTSAFTTGVAEHTFGYGVPNGGWKPLVGDWNGDGTTGVGLYAPNASAFYLTNTLTTGVAEIAFSYGQPSGPWSPAWTPLIGHWNALSSLQAADPQPATGGSIPAPNPQSLVPLVATAIAHWTAAGASVEALATMSQARVQFADLGAGQLGETLDRQVFLDSTAAGHGWFIDPTPALDEEFTRRGASDQLTAVDPAAVDRIDLLTVVEHELGHLAGLTDLDPTSTALMSGALPIGVRRVVR